MLALNADEKNLLSKGMRDSYTLKMVKKPKKKLDKSTWQIIMNMDMYQFYLNMDKAKITIKNMILAQTNGYNLCSGLEVSGRSRYLLEGACFYKNEKAIGYLVLVAGCNLDQI